MRRTICRHPNPNGTTCRACDPAFVPGVSDTPHYSIELTARECRELCRALETASAFGSVPEKRAYRLWVMLDNTAGIEGK